MSASSSSEGDTIDILSTADSWLAAGEDVALATVIATWGSSPARRAHC